VRFEWDDAKNQKNIIKHGIDFLQASTVFDDLNAVVMEDASLQYGEARYQIIGSADPVGIIFVVFAEREGDIIRLISARKATKQEKRIYQQHS